MGLMLSKCLALTGLKSAGGPVGENPPTVVIDALTNSGSGATSVDVTGLVQAGDLLFLGVSTANEFITAEDITGAGAWELLAEAGTGTVGDTLSAGMQVFWKVSEGDETVINVADSGDHTLIGLVSVRGYFQASPFNGAAVLTSDPGPPYPMDGPVTSVPNCLVLGFLSIGDNVTVNSLANANLGSLTQRINTASASGNDGTIYAFSGVKVDPGDVGDTTVGITTSVGEDGASVVFAINPL